MLTSADQFVGQHLARGLLDGYLRKDRVAGTFLFTGERGLGKTTLATIFARAITCERNREQPRLWFCNQCYACRTIALGEQPEYVVVRPEGQKIKVSQFMTARKSRRGDDDDEGGRDEKPSATGVDFFYLAALHPVHLSHRIFVIDDAHYLNEETASQLLKTLEEPSSHSIFMLITDKPQMLPSTILSRSHKLSLVPTGEAELAARTAPEAAAMSGGRYVDAQHLSANAEWRSSVKALAGALAEKRRTVEAAKQLAEYEFAAAWTKQVDDMMIESADADKSITAPRKNELQRQALITAYERAAWWLLRSSAHPLLTPLAKLKQRINQNVDPLLAQVAFELAL